ncbi:hypothetical protein KKF70_06740 [bacterium]|nr:hypothetical protein [bacterium]MBU4123590.1 hypothetical protein [bacterium]
MKKKITEAKDERKPIIILGVAIDPISMPRLYRRAAKDPGWVEMQVKGMMKAQGFKRPGMPMAILDSDLH